MKRSRIGRLLAVVLALALVAPLAVSASAEGRYSADQSYEEDTAQTKVFAVRVESDDEEPEALRDRLLDAGFDAYLYKDQWRVYVFSGKFVDSSDARAYKKELAEALDGEKLYTARAWLPAEAVKAFEAGPQEAAPAEEKPKADHSQKTNSWENVEGSSAYSVALSASREQSYAENLAAQMRKKGFDAFVLEENGVYQVLSGKFRNLCTALQYRDCIWSNTDRKDTYITEVTLNESDIVAFLEDLEINGLPGPIKTGLEEPTGPYYPEGDGDTLAYVVQVSAGTSFRGAEQTRDRYLDAGYPAFVYECSRVYEIMCGGFYDRADAEAMLEDIRMNVGWSSAYVTTAWLPSAIVK